MHISGFSYMVSTGPSESHWATPTNTDRTVDLITLSATEISWLNFDVPKGTVIVGVAFRIDEATAIIDGVEHGLIITNKVITAQNLNW